MLKCYEIDDFNVEYGVYLDLIPIGTESLYYDFFLQKTIREFFHPLKASDVRIPRNAQEKPIGINMIYMTNISIVLLFSSSFFFMGKGNRVHLNT